MIPRVRTDNPLFTAKVKRMHSGMRKSLATIEDLLSTAEALPGDFLDTLQRACDLADDAATRAAQLAIPKVRP